MTAGFWTRDRIASLRRIIAVEGKTYDAAAIELGTTKNACIGKAHRLGGIERRPDAPLTDAQRSRIAANRKRNAMPVEPKSSFPPPGRCVWPIGDPGDRGFHFCGDGVRILGEPYCEAHAKIAYVPQSISEKHRAAWTEERKIRASLAARQRLEARASR